LPDSAIPLRHLKRFGEIACEIGEKYKKAIFITAAMAEGTGLVEYSRKFRRVTSTSELLKGMRSRLRRNYAPVVSGGVAFIRHFLQRAYDHIIHDVALQNFRSILYLTGRSGWRRRTDPSWGFRPELLEYHTKI
jgi:1-deoxy-D-xylulose-5-phosphate synthase